MRRWVTVAVRDEAHYGLQEPGNKASHIRRRSTFVDIGAGVLIAPLHQRLVRAIAAFRLEVACLAVLTLAALTLHGWIALWDESIVSFSDSMDYLFLADFYRAVFLGDAAVPAVPLYNLSRYPPLFPLLLAAIGAGVAHQQVASLASNGMAVLAVLATFAWVRAEGERPLTAMLMAAALLCLPYWIIVNLSPLAEPLALLLCVAAFALLAGPEPSYKRLVIAGVLIGLAPLARGALLPLPMAFVIWLALRRTLPWTRQLGLIALVWAPMMVWMAQRAGTTSQSYFHFMTATQYIEVGILWPNAIWSQPLTLFRSFCIALGASSNLVAQASAAVLCALALAGLLIRLRTNRIDAWFLAGYVSLVLIWPFPQEYPRFLTVAFPCVLVCALTAIRAFVLAAGRPRWVAGTSLAVFYLMAALPGVWSTASRALVPVPPELLGEKREPGFFLAGSNETALLMAEAWARGRFLLAQASEHVQPDECIYVLPYQVGALYTGRQVIPYPRGLTNSTRNAESELSKCDWFFVGYWQSPSWGIPALYPLDAIRGWTEPVLVSNMETNGKTHLAAALLRRRHDQHQSAR